MSPATLLACVLAVGDGGNSSPAAGPAAGSAMADVGSVAGLPADDLRRQVVEAVDGAREWLVKNQNPDGSFGTHDSPRPIELYCTVPSGHEAYRFATTALAVMALDQCARPSEAAAKAASRGIDWMLVHKKVRRTNGFEFYNTWTLGYGLQCFGEYLGRHQDDPRKEAITGAIRELLDRLPKYQVLDGGFNYLDFGIKSMPPSDSSTSFTTATVLIGVERCQKLGLTAPPSVVDRAITRLAADQTPEGSFLYGRYLWEQPRMGINQPKGSACRTPGNLYALELFGKEPKRGAYSEALDNLAIKHLRFQQAGVRRPWPHESWYMISGYFYLYGFYYASLVLDEKLPDAEQRRLFPALARGVLFCRQPDGSFWDYPVYTYHYAYGTAYALLSLSRAPKSFFTTF